MSYQSVGQEAVARLHAQREIERLRAETEALRARDEEAQDLTLRCMALRAERDALSAECGDLRDFVQRVYTVTCAMGIDDDLQRDYLARFPWLQTPT